MHSVLSPHDHGAMLRTCIASLPALFSLALAAPLCAQHADNGKPGPKVPNRIEEIERIRKEFAPADGDKQYGPQDRITISGTVSTADGSPLPENLTIGGMSRRTNYGASVYAPVNAQGRFTGQVEFGRISLYVAAPGYAPALLPPLAAEPGGKVENIRFVLQRGFTGKIRLTNDQGEPIAGAKVKAMYLHGENGGFAHVNELEVVTDMTGLAVLDHCADRPLTVESDPPGFQGDRTELHLKPDKVADWKLRKARPTTGVVLTREDRTPIPGAELRLLQRDGFNPRTHPPFDPNRKPPLLAKTDESGRFTLDSLRDDSRYAILVSAPDRGREVLAEIRSGQSEVRVDLGPPRSIRGVLTGDLSRLQQSDPNDRDRRSFMYVNPLRLGSNMYQYGMNAPVEIRNGRGEFEIKDLFPGEVRLQLPGVVKTLQVNESIEDLVIDLPAQPTAAPASGPAPRRNVVLKFNIPEGDPPPRGALVVNCYPMRAGASYERKVLPLNGAQVEFDAPVPCRLMWQTDGLIGYWVKPNEQVELAEAPAPLVKEIDAIPAGAIYGQVLAPDGSPAQGFSLMVHTVTPAPGVQNPYLGVAHNTLNQADGRFVLGPLPLGGVYRVEIQGQGARVNTRAASEDLTLTREESVRLVKLRLPDGTDVAGRVIDPEGKAVPGVEVRLGHRTANRSHEGVAQQTDADGRFRFEHVNTELPGAYYIHVQPQQKYRGQQAVWKPDSEITVQLKRGRMLEGLLVEHSTGKVIPNAQLYAQPAVFDQNFYLGRHELRTDSVGRFRYDTLEPIPYRFYAHGVNAAQGAPPWEVDPRSTSEIILSGDISQGSELVPVPPPPDER